MLVNVNSITAKYFKANITVHLLELSRWPIRRTASKIVSAVNIIIKFLLTNALHLWPSFLSTTSIFQSNTLQRAFVDGMSILLVRIINLSGPQNLSHQTTGHPSPNACMGLSIWPIEFLFHELKTRTNHFWNISISIHETAMHFEKQFLEQDPISCVFFQSQVKFEGCNSFWIIDESPDACADVFFLQVYYENAATQPTRFTVRHTDSVLGDLGCQVTGNNQLTVHMGVFQRLFYSCSKVLAKF